MGFFKKETTMVEMLKTHSFAIHLRLYSSVAEHRFCKPGVGGSNPSTGFFSKEKKTASQNL